MSPRRVLKVGAVVTLLLALLVLLAPTALLNPLVRNAVSDGGGCSQLLGFRVDSGPWPAVGRAVTGHLRGVSADIDEIRFDDGFSFYDVRFSADEVDVAPLGLALFGRDAEVHGGETSATVLLDDIERVVAGEGYTVELSGQGSTLVADIDVPPFGPIPTLVEITPVEGDLELVFAPLAVFVMPAVRVPIPAPLSVRAVEVRGDAIQVDSTVEGRVRADDFAC